MSEHDDTLPGDPNLGDESARDLEILSNHISRWWDDVTVFHELSSQYVHLDLHISRASAERPFHVVITTGMSDRPMIAKNGKEYYCELLLALPPEWSIAREDFKDEKIWWPFRHLKQTARFPHVLKTLLWYGHTITNETPPRPFHPTAPFSGGILSMPVFCPDEALSIHIREGKEVFFFSFIPLFESELQFAWTQGVKALFAKLDDGGVNELINPSRSPVV